MQKIERYLKIAETIRDNVSESDPEIALYLQKILKEMGENSDQLEKLSTRYCGNSKKLISETLHEIKSRIQGSNRPITYHIKGYLGGALMTLIIFSLVHIYIQSEKMRRQAPLRAKFSVWDVSYFCNEKLEGIPCKTEKRENINADWKGDVPSEGVPASQFSIRYQSCVDLGDKKQEVFFSIGADDGYRLILDGKIIKEEWKIQGFEPQIFAHKIEAGKHIITLEYYQGSGASKIELKAGSHRTKINDLIFDTSLNPNCSN